MQISVAVYRKIYNDCSYLKVGNYQDVSATCNESIFGKNQIRKFPILFFYPAALNRDLLQLVFIKYPQFFNHFFLIDNSHDTKRRK